MADMLRPVPIDIEPKMSNRWVLEFPADLEFAEWMVESAARPSISISEIAIPFMNVETKIAGKATWSNIVVKFIDCIGPSTAQKVMQWVRMCVEYSTGRMGYATNYKKNLVLKMLDPAGETVEKWLIHGAFIVSTDFGSVDYAQPSIVNVSITLAFDNAILEF